MLSDARKLGRFAQIYGLRKTAFKALSRQEPLPSFVRLPSFASPTRRDVGVIGCGQFAFATIGHELTKVQGNRFSACFDPRKDRASKFGHFYGCEVKGSPEEVIHDPSVKYIYIASNHASHSDYAVSALDAGKTVYVEKPIAVTHDQLAKLYAAQQRGQERLFFGYNRPFSGAIRELRKVCAGAAHEPMTLSCFVACHKLPSDHWYREPTEGTRICGNVGHWLDLMTHIRSWGDLEDSWQITIAYSNVHQIDENMTLSLTSERGSLVNITMTERHEPFEGINEQLSFQMGPHMAHIDDFRSMTLRTAENFSRLRFWPKDVGHRSAINQPFQETRRDPQEVFRSSLLMLRIKDMVCARERFSAFSFDQAARATFGHALD
ncbi:MAG: Gfo/Idh/MocA family oxidoreductase [Myxococcales bacterium]|nr:Gfo/Idh/MocA family oxidoreductase [Myxococcales bacterium]